MTRDDVKIWLVRQTTSIENIDVEKQSMLGEDVIDLMYSLVNKHVVLGDVVNSFYCQTEHEKGGSRCPECCGVSDQCFFKND